MSLPSCPQDCGLSTPLLRGRPPPPGRAMLALMDIGAILRAAREECGLAQVVVAERAGITPQALSRWETGSRPVRSDDADRVLAACGKDIRFVLVHRHADLDDTLKRLAAQPVHSRMRQLRQLLSPETLDDLQLTGGVVLTGGWAVAALGMPPLHDVGGLLVSSDSQEQARVAAVLRPLFPARIAPGGPWSVMWNDEVFQRYPSARWQSSLLGEFTTDMKTQLLPEVQLRAEAVPWRVVEPSYLVPQHVDQLTLDRWLRLRAT